MLIYNIHEPDLLDIAKGEEHILHRFANISSFADTRKFRMILGEMAVEGSSYDGFTLQP